MALLDSTDDIAGSHRSTQLYEKTKHPMVCLAGGFAVIAGSGLLVHLLFTLF